MSCYFFFPATFDDAQGWMDRLKWIFNQLARLGIRLGQLPGQHGQDGGEDDSDEDKEQHTPKTRDGKEGTRCDHWLKSRLANCYGNFSFVLA